MTHSSPRRSAAKPSVPAGFPLWWHPSGRWAKKVRGRAHYFGRDPDAALAEWLRVKDYLLAGRRPPAAGNVTTVAGVAEAFLNSRHRKLDAGELTKATLQGYVTTMSRMVQAFGRDRPAGDLGPEDFAELRADFARTHGPAALATDVQHVRTCFKWAVEAELLPALPRFGDFKKPPTRVLRAAWNAKTRTMTPDEIRAMLDAANPLVRCCLFLGINAGFGPHDCMALPKRCVDLDGQSVDFPRPKTAVSRRAWLWPEAVAALQEYEATRPDPRRPEWGDFFFLSLYGKPYASDGGGCKLTAMFRELARQVGVYRAGLSAYSLRHTFRHVADQTLDQVAAAIVMGHADPSIASRYRGEVPGVRIRAVCQYVRQWLFAPDPAAGDDEEPATVLFRQKIG